ncbi:hypothetical protein DCC85_06025 [Paenibacillus sp. CAA11]|uniref:hypothetical protein n=1 Tax=Paenibacillus sp. CAA11 TaxID=1532905 RepID=UPI000D3A3705|nr:hypothetical protein [Paenibacillus sp. CAA11]AWB43826.1 hypothetical protein DCC85_06025 [Paenibacillus sp. CAA11]
MAKSAARKQRDKLVREGKRNPADSRSMFAAIDLRSRTTKTKKELLNSSRHLKNQFSKYGEDGSFLFWEKITA